MVGEASSHDDLLHNTTFISHYLAAGYASPRSMPIMGIKGADAIDEPVGVDVHMEDHSSQEDQDSEQARSQHVSSTSTSEGGDSGMEDLVRRRRVRELDCFVFALGRARTISLSLLHIAWAPS
jgi:hypothetical protein